MPQLEGEALVQVELRVGGWPDHAEMVDTLRHELLHFQGLLQTPRDFVFDARGR